LSEGGSHEYVDLVWTGDGVDVDFRMIATMVLLWREGVRMPWWGMRGSHTRETPRQLLDRPYASREITKEQDDELKQTLEL
jgi:hypothetical protein